VTLTYKNLIVEWRWVGTTPCLMEMYPREEGKPFIFPKKPSREGVIDIEGVSVLLPQVSLVLCMAERRIGVFKNSG
jgi:hypothetical protein